LKKMLELLITRLIKFRAMSPLLLLVTVFISSQTTAAGGPTYVCSPDQSIGFEYNESSGSWQSFARDGGDEVLLIDQGPRSWRITVIGAAEGTTFDCKISEMSNAVVHCLHESGTTLIEFDEDALRYTVSLVTGYAFNWYINEGKVTPMMAIGQCVTTNW